jgi:multidrug efflux pump subunit AcrB
MDRYLKMSETYVAKQPEVDRLLASVGGMGGGGVNSGTLFITLWPPEQRKVSPSRIRVETPQGAQLRTQASARSCRTSHNRA